MGKFLSTHIARRRLFVATTVAILIAINIYIYVTWRYVPEIWSGQLVKGPIYALVAQILMIIEIVLALPMLLLFVAWKRQATEDKME